MFAHVLLHDGYGSLDTRGHALVGGGCGELAVALEVLLHIPMGRGRETKVRGEGVRGEVRGWRGGERRGERVERGLEEKTEERWCEEVR